MNKKVRIALIGAGRIGKLHGENLAHSVPDVELVSISDPFMNDATRAWAKSLGVENCYESADMISQTRRLTQYSFARLQTHTLITSFKRQLQANTSSAKNPSIMMLRASVRRWLQWNKQA